MRRAELERVRAVVRQDFPPLAPDLELVTALGALRVERERQGLSLADLTERTQMDASTLANLEAGTMPSPTVQTLRAYAHAGQAALVDDPGPRPDHVTIRSQTRRTLTGYYLQDRRSRITYGVPRTKHAIRRPTSFPVM